MSETEFLNEEAKERRFSHSKIEAEEANIYEMDFCRSFALRSAGGEPGAGL